MELFIKKCMKNKLTKPIHNYGKGFCGIGIYRPKTWENVGTLIRSAKMFGADFVFTIGNRYHKQASDVKLSTKIPVFYFETLEDFYISMPPVEKYIGIDLCSKSKKLQEFKHPKQGIYMLGSEDNGLPKEIIENDRFRFVEIEGNSSLNVAVAGSIILYDRSIKL
jgi:tRNA(Leu) C34 or U34 (ribose-2'-O)-methylase TrmL